MSKKIAFMGTPVISGQILKSLYQNGFDVEVVYTQPPVESNRGQKLNKSPVHIMSEILNIPVRTPFTEILRYLFIVFLNIHTFF